MDDNRPSWYPPTQLLRWTAIAACAVVIGVAVIGLAVLLSRLRFVLVPIVVTTLIVRVLIVPSNLLEQRGWRPAPRAAATTFGFLAAVVLLVTLIAPPLAAELSDLGPTLRDGVDQVKDWIVRDGPVDIDRDELDRLEEQAIDQAESALTGSQVAAGAQLALETLTGLILAVILSFFAIKDGASLQQWALDRLPADSRDQAAAMVASSWSALGGYLRGAAMLGAVEAVIIGIALALVGADLVLPLMLLTFVAAFIPLVGATLAGAAAVLTALVTAGFTEAVIVLVVAVLVQQFDNDLLAPWIYGKALELHPAGILLAIATGTALFGFAGTVLAVPVTAVTLAAITGHRQHAERAAPP